MNTILISYDLNSPGQNYDNLIKHIKGHYSWCKVLKSAWAVSTSKSTTTVRDECKSYLDANDDLFVVNITGAGWASSGLDSQITKWLKEH